MVGALLLELRLELLELGRELLQRLLDVRFQRFLLAP
jgi:hypothetical protein